MKWINPTTHEETFVSPHDQSRQTYLVAEFGKGARANQPLLVLYLHGALSHQDQGMTPEIFNDCFGRLAKWMAERDVIYICPEYRGNSWMGRAAEDDVREIFRAAHERHHPSQSLLIGGSMGGTSALIFVARNPGLVDGVLAFCPAVDMTTMYKHFPEHFLASYGKPPDEIPEIYRERSVRYHAGNLASQRLAIIHGSSDHLMPVENIRQLVADLRATNSSLRYQEIEQGDHDAPLIANYLPMLDWLADR